MRKLNILFALLLFSHYLHAQNHELKTGLLGWVTLDPNIYYEFSKGKTGIEIGGAFITQKIRIGNGIDLPEERYRRHFLEGQILFKYYFKELNNKQPVVTYIGTQLRPRTHAGIEKGYVSAYTEFFGEEPDLSGLVSLPFELVIGIKSIVKQSRPTLDGRAWLGVDLKTLINDESFVSVGIGLDLRIGYLFRKSGL